jgi:hypothetical protein
MLSSKNARNREWSDLCGGHERLNRIVSKAASACPCLRPAALHNFQKNVWVFGPFAVYSNGVWAISVVDNASLVRAPLKYLRAFLGCGASGTYVASGAVGAGPGFERNLKSRLLNFEPELRTFGDYR